MTTRRWFRASLFLPFAVPILLAPFLKGPESLQVVAWFAVMALVFGGIPYLPFAIVMARVMKRSPPRRVIRLALAAPFLFAPVEAVAVLLFIAIAPALGQGRPHGSYASSALAMAGFALVVGLAYSVLALGLYGVVRLCGGIHDATPTPAEG